MITLHAERSQVENQTWNLVDETGTVHGTAEVGFTGRFWSYTTDRVIWSVACDSLDDAVRFHQDCLNCTPERVADTLARGRALMAAMKDDPA